MNRKQFTTNTGLAGEIERELRHNADRKQEGKSRHLSSIHVNGRKSEGYFVSHELFKKGGRIDITTK
jgi:hypothetical protein